MQVEVWVKGGQLQKSAKTASKHFVLDLIYKSSHAAQSVQNGVGCAGLSSEAFSNENKAQHW